MEFTKKEAESLGLLTCECGYPKNNHFDFGKKVCAHTENCTGYKEVARVGKILPTATNTKAKSKKF